VAGVPYGIVFSFADDGAGNIWMSHQEGLLHVSGTRVAERIPWARLGRRQPAGALLHDAVRGGLWLGFKDGGFAYFKDGQLRESYAGAGGPGEGDVRGFFVDRNGILWAPTAGGLSRIKDGHILTLTTQNGLPCNTVHWMIEDDAGSVWLLTACGVVRIGWSELDAWASQSKPTIDVTVFDRSDGVTSHRTSAGFNAAVAKSSDGKLWFVRNVGLSVIDPYHLAFNKLPPPVHIERVTADDKIYDATNGLRLPPRTRNVAIDYTALSFVAPEKVRFRYKLEGQNQNWHDVVNDRQIQYTNLAPGPYRFRVAASNNSGVWNEAGATLEFSIAPAFYQTRWFQAAMAFSFVALLFAAYQWRVAQLARQFNRTLEARVGERTRIARELHDTLLQSFHGLLLKFQTVAYLLPERPTEARQQLAGAIDHAAKAITEGRDAVQGLRSSTIERNDLAMAIRTLGDGIASDTSAPTASGFSVAVEGETRDLHPIVRDEIYKIAAEALRNAFRHAQPSRIEVELRYDDEQFRLRVRDDGTGIDPKLLANQGLDGHYGLRGMPERAEMIDGKLAIWSEVGTGTEVELRLPARRAYAQPPRRSWLSRARVSCLLLAAILLGPATSHGQQLAQYAHTAWGFQQGVFDAAPVSIAQTTDGFLWIGTLNGLVRFDGVHFESWNDRLHQLNNTCCALSLLGSSDGNLWIGTTVGLAKLSGGKLSAVTNGDGRYNQLIEDRKGRIWAARSRIRDNKGPLCEVEGTQVHCHGEHDNLGCQNGNVLSQDNSGTVWVGDLGKICGWNNGPAATYSAPAADPACKPAINSILAGVDRSMVIACEGGLRRLEQGGFVPFRPASLDANKLRGAKLLYDRRGGLWIGTTNDGLYRVVNGVADHIGAADGLSDDKVSDLFEDREGNIWVVSPEGIDRFHRVSVVSFSSRQGFRGIGGSAVLASRDGQTIWTTGLQGLAAMKDGKVNLITQKEGLPGQQVTALLEDDRGALWMGIDQDLFSYANGRFTRKVRSDGKPTGMVVGMAEDAGQSIWIVNTGTQRLLRLDPRAGAAEAVTDVQEPTRLTSSPKGLVYVFAYPLGEISITRNGDAWDKILLPTGPRTGRSLLAYGEDTLFVSTDTGLYRWRDRQWSSLTAKNGLPCDAVQDQVNDEDGGLWLRLTCGFVHISKRDLDAWSLDTTIRLDLALFDAFDGARAGLGNFEPRHGRTANGQLWFANGSVLQMIDPRNLAVNELPPPVHIQQVTADGTAYDATNGLRLPPRVRNLAIDYTALSLIAPDKMRFRYRLEGQDADWKEVVNDRQVQYSNLAPGSYRFRVMASNNSGVWNESGATLEFAIAPAFYQTRWFQAAMMFGFTMLLWLAYRWRVAQLAKQFNRTLDARVSERTRIARELHDTLLQSFHGLLLQFQTAAYLLEERPADGRKQLDGAIVHAANAITEGRNAVQGLRSSALERNDLAIAIRAQGDALVSAASATPAPDFSVAIEGATRDLHPIVRDEIYKIATEALRNAFRHAHARRIEVELRYDDEQFRLRVRDDGQGIDSVVLAGQGIEGHFGLRGMPERAGVIGGKLAVWSEVGVGTEIELRLPASIVYATTPRRSWWSRVLAPTTAANQGHGDE
jgi:signal transduction histidine kinase/ligand-binding sensor domain-containing protein